MLLKDHVIRDERDLSREKWGMGDIWPTHVEEEFSIPLGDNKRSSESHKRTDDYIILWDERRNIQILTTSEYILNL